MVLASQSTALEHFDFWPGDPIIARFALENKGEKHWTNKKNNHYA